jgi:hypothetical protein
MVNMRSRTGIFVCVVLMISLPLATIPAAADDVTGRPDLSVTLADNTVTPGEETMLEFSVTNSGRVVEGTQQNLALTNRVTTARGLTVTAADGAAPVEIETETQAIGNLPEGTTNVGFAISVAEDAEPGSYTVPVTAEYTYTRAIQENTQWSRFSRTETFDVTVQVEPDAQLQIDEIQSDTRVGTEGTVNLTVTNAGTSTAYDASLELASKNAGISFGQSETASRALGDWESGETRTLSYEVSTASSAKSQQYALSATLQYRGQDGEQRTSQSQTFGLTPQRQQRFSVESVESTVAIDDTGEMTLTMENSGPTAVTDATVQVSSTTTSLSIADSQEATRFVGAWSPGETKQLQYDLTASGTAEAQRYALETTVSYENREGDDETAPSTSFGVVPEPEQSFAIATVDSNLSVGKEGTLRGTVRNTATTAADSVVVTFESDKETVTPIERQYPVGDLAAGATEDFSFPLEISEAAEAGPQQYELAVQYRNQNDEKRTTDTFDIRQVVGPDTPVFAVETNTTTVGPGGSTQMNVTVRNQGSETLSDISANLFAETPITADDDSGFISQLEPGESATLRFSLSASGSALETTYPVSVDFQYDEPDGDTKLSNTYKIAVSVDEGEEGEGGLPLIPIVVTAVIGIVAFYAYRRYS